MTVRVKLFAVARELAGCDELAVSVAGGATIADVRRAVEDAAPALQRILSHSLWAVDASYAGDDVTVCECSEVALIPPVSGG
jgi:molybdopterin synthase catalytic subunit/molybdopterin synthase sulfur carrier subunit